MCTVYTAIIYYTVYPYIQRGTVRVYTVYTPYYRVLYIIILIWYILIYGILSYYTFIKFTAVYTRACTLCYEYNKIDETFTAFYLDMHTVLYYIYYILLKPCAWNHR